MCKRGLQLFTVYKEVVRNVVKFSLKLSTSICGMACAPTCQWHHYFRVKTHNLTTKTPTLTTKEAIRTNIWSHFI